MLSTASVVTAADPDSIFKPISYSRYGGEQKYVMGVPCGQPSAPACAPGACCETESCGACDDCCCCPCPTWGPCACSNWYGGGEAVFLKRNRAENHVLSFLDNLNSTILQTDDLEFDYELGYRALVGTRYNECTAFEVSYLSLRDWDTTADAFTPDVNDPQLDPYWGSQVDAFPTDSFDDSVTHSANYESKLTDIEANMRHFLSCNCSLIAGFRYINLDESFDFTSIDSVGASRYARYNLDTDNNLYGFQLGLARQWCCGCKFSFGAYGKAGVFFNDVDSDHRFVNVTSSGLDRDERTSKSDNSWATIVDLGLKGTYCVNDHVRLNAGYMIVFLNNVALAPEQLADAPNQLPLSAGSLNDNGSLVYQGPTAGIDVCW